MPYKSLQQERYFHWAQEHGKMPQKTVNEFDQASKGMKLPQYAPAENEEEKDPYPHLTNFFNQHKQGGY